MGARGSWSAGWPSSDRATWWTTPQRAVSGAQREEATDSSATRSHCCNVATSSLRRQPRHLRHQPQRPGSLLSTHSGPRAKAVCSSSAGAGTRRPLPGLAVYPMTALGHRRGTVEAISAKARWWPGTHGGARVDMTCASLLRLGDRVLIAASRSASRSPTSPVCRSAQPARPSDQAGPAATVLPPGVPQQTRS
jgi:hypothetical protein